MPGGSNSRPTGMLDHSSRRLPPPALKRARPGRRAVILLGAAIPVLAVLFGLIVFISIPHGSGKEVRLDEFRQMVQQGHIRSALLLKRDDIIEGRSADGEYFVNIYQATAPDLLQQLDQAGVPTTVDQQSFKQAVGTLIFIVPPLLFVDALLLVFILSRGGASGLETFGRASPRLADSDQHASFSEVAGADEAVEELKEIRDFLADPERFTSVGASVPKGVLLTGPPGCGKTLLARAVAGEAGVPFLSISGSDFVELYVGVGAARIRDLFRAARKQAPAIIFIDELDAVGKGRLVTGGQDEREATLNQLLVEMDGFDSHVGVVVLAATNRPDVLDSALLRPGRFDRRLVIDQPDVRGRAAILEVHARSKRLEPGVDLERLARRTPGFSGADLANVLNEAALLTARRGTTTIGEVELDAALDRLIAGPERRSRVMSEDERRTIAFHEAGHALVAARLLPNEPISKISIVARGWRLGYIRSAPTEERSLLTKVGIRAQAAVLQAGRAAEIVSFGHASSGARDDLSRATDLVRMMILELGMSERLGPVSFQARDGQPGVTDWRPSEAVAAAVDDEVRMELELAEETAVNILEGNRGNLNRLVDALLERETLLEADLDELLLRQVEAPRTGLAATPR